MPESFKLEGAAEWDRQLAALGEKVATEIGRDAVIASAELLRDAWQAGAPYNPDQRGASKQYGHARDNMRIGPVRNKNVHAIVYRVSTGDAYWLHFYEYGSVHQPARPTFRPINERMRPMLIETQVEKLNEGIEAAVAGR